MEIQAVKIVVAPNTGKRDPRHGKSLIIPNGVPRIIIEPSFPSPEWQTF